jgi:DNA-directed RNA polymerase subunit RPC12/RpoP
MDTITTQPAKAVVTTSNTKEEYVFRISRHSRGIIIKTSSNSELDDTLFLDSELDIAQDLLFTELSRILQTSRDMVKSDTKYVCPKCKKEVMQFSEQKNRWVCTHCKYEIPHYERS